MGFKVAFVVANVSSKGGNHAVHQDSSFHSVCAKYHLIIVIYIVFHCHELRKKN